MTEPDENGIILGKEYLWMPRGPEADFASLRGKPFIPRFYLEREGMYEGDLLGNDGWCVYPDELVDPEVP